MILHQINPIIAASQNVYIVMAGLIFLIIGLAATSFALWYRMSRLEKKLNDRFSSNFFARTKNRKGVPNSLPEVEKGEDVELFEEELEDSEDDDEDGKNKMPVVEDGPRSFRQLKGVKNTQGMVVFKTLDDDKNSSNDSSVTSRKKIVVEKPPTPRPPKKASPGGKEEKLGDGWFYIAKGGEEGPVPENELKSLIESAVIDNDSILRREGANVETYITESEFSEYYFSHGYFKFRCPVCGQKVKSRFGWAGRHNSCPGCSTALIIPAYNPDSDSIAAEA